MGVVSPPQALNQTHKLDGFDCGSEVLNEWLQKRALKNQMNGASRCFVICDSEDVIGFYALAMGSIERIQASAAIARNMPENIPVMVLGRLAIDQSRQSQGYGSALLKDALLRALLVSREVGLAAILVHALSEHAKAFYQQYGFKASPMEAMTLLLPIKALSELQEN